jgi:hypothetical protein
LRKEVEKIKMRKLVSRARRLPLVTLCLVTLAKRATSSHAADAWKVKGGFGTLSQDPINTDWASHDSALDNFLKESIPEALAHTGTDLISQ